MKKLFALFAAALLLCSVCLFIFFTRSSPHHFVKEKEIKGEAWAALQFLNTSRAFPNDDIPEDAMTRAFEYYKANFADNMMRKDPGSPSGQTTMQWQNIGPNNLGGRTLGMAIDPTDTSIIWLGSASGGLWKSTTGGLGVNAWKHVPTGFPVRGVSSIAINPANKNEMYIGTGETHSYGTVVNGLVTRPTRGSVGVGILKSMDGGLSWTHTLNWNYNQIRGVWDIVFNPLNPNKVYAATTEGVYETKDAGNTWTLVLNEKMVMDLEIDPVDTARVYAGVGNVYSPNPGIYRTTNSGSTWTRLTTGLPVNVGGGRISLRILPQNHNTVFAMIGDLYNTIGLYRSRDKGNTWATVNNTQDVLTYQGWYCKGIWIKSNDSARVMLGGVNIFRSTNGGTNINNVTTNNFHSDVHDIIGNPLNANKLYILTDGGLYRSNNFGNTSMSFYDCTDGYVTSQFYIGSVSQTDSNMILCGAQDNYSNQYVGSLYWNQVIGGDGSFNAIDPNDDFIQYGSYQYLNVEKSTDRGSNWNTILSNPSGASGNNPCAFIAPLILCNANTNQLYGGGKTLFISTNAGASWSQRPGQVDSGNYIMTIATSNTFADSIYFATAPEATRAMHVFRSANRGTTLTNISTGLPNRFPRDIAVDPFNSKEVYIAFSGFGAGHIYKSINAGSTWTDITGTLPDVPFHAIEIVPTNSDTIFLGSDLGVFVSKDRGATWTDFNLGMPDGSMVFDLRYSPADNSLVAFTFGNGVYKRSLTEIPLGVPATKFFAQDFTQTVISNPVYQNLSMLINSGINAKAAFSVYDLSGNMVKQTKEQSITTGNNLIHLDVTGLGSGVYFIRTIAGKEQKTNKFILF